MTNEQIIHHEFRGNICRIRVYVQPQNKGCIANTVNNGRVENIRNCDLFVDNENFLIFADVRLFKFHSTREFDMKDLKNVMVKFNTKEKFYELELPCMQQSEELKVQAEKGDLDKLTTKCAENERTYNIWKLKRITDNCRLEVDDTGEPLKFESNYGFGFAGKFKGKVDIGDSDVVCILRMPEPNATSPLQRSIDREIDELKDFSPEQYKLNLVELQVPEGHDNPLKYKFTFSDTQLSKEEEYLLHNLTRTPEDFEIPSSHDQSTIDYGLVSIILAVCYDVRTTCNEPTCKSAWTRSMLSATLTYFEPFENLKEVVISFLRRAIIYPLYRNYDLARLCVEDAVEALRQWPAWVLKQLLVTHQLFASCDWSRELLNRYYIEDYIRYVHNNATSPEARMTILARNLKNILLDVFKKTMRMNLVEIETKLLKEIIDDMHIQTPNTDDESEELGDSEYDDDSEDYSDSGEEEDEITSASEVDDNSLIET